ncbi:hypothetical protein IFM89_022465 [Coptis chinensis]|uniref:Uncharacterized protein n=1 Tax=Coptis chinensis TaxID=261450 RepID=A0A835M0K9_9MAGN|nr:hypothetical protein IFM89_022465 [Coptis chinensis]
MMFEKNHDYQRSRVLIVIQSISWITTTEVINISDVPPLIIEKSSLEKIEEGLATARTAIREAVRTRNYTAQKEEDFIPRGSPSTSLRTKANNIIVEKVQELIASKDRLAMETEETIPKETMVEKADEDKEFVVGPKRRI